MVALKIINQSNSGWEKSVWLGQGGGSMNLIRSHIFCEEG